MYMVMVHSGLDLYALTKPSGHEYFSLYSSHCAPPQDQHEVFPSAAQR